MARKSKARRLLAAQGKAAAPLKALRSAMSDTEMACLQRGSPRNNSQAKFDRMTARPILSRERSWESTGRATQSVKSKPVSSVPLEPSHVRTATFEPVYHTDKLREHYMRAWKNGRPVK